MCILTAKQVNKERPKQNQLAIYRTKTVYMIAIAGGNEDTDCSTHTPMVAVRELGRHLIVNKL